MQDPLMWALEFLCFLYAAPPASAGLHTSGGCYYWTRVFCRQHSYRTRGQLRVCIMEPP